MLDTIFIEIASPSLKCAETSSLIAVVWSSVSVIVMAVSTPFCCNVQVVEWPIPGGLMAVTLIAMARNFWKAVNEIGCGDENAVPGYI